MKKIAILILLAILSGCTSLQRNGGGIEEAIIDYPPLGIESTVGVGEEMLKKGKNTTVNAISLKQKVSVGLFGAYTFLPGIYKQVGHSKNKIFYSPVSYGMVQKAALADPYGGMYVDHDKEEICGVSTLGGTVCSKASFEVIKYTSSEMLSFQKTLLYSGKIGTKVNISYREFSNNVARPAFSNDVEYDLNESNTIGYKGALLKIIKATNQDITYRVIRNFR